MEVTLGELAHELEAAAVSMPARAAAVVAKNALHVKTEARRNATVSSGRHAAQYPSKIGFDLADGGLAADIGPAKEGQGYLGPILENGAVNAAGTKLNPPHRDLGRALDKVEPLFLAEVAKLGVPWV